MTRNMLREDQKKAFRKMLSEDLNACKYIHPYKQFIKLIKRAEHSYYKCKALVDVENSKFSMSLTIWRALQKTGIYTYVAIKDLRKINSHWI